MAGAFLTLTSATAPCEKPPTSGLGGIRHKSKSKTQDGQANGQRDIALHRCRASRATMLIKFSQLRKRGKYHQKDGRWRDEKFSLRTWDARRGRRASCLTSGFESQFLLLTSKVATIPVSSCGPDQTIRACTRTVRGRESRRASAAKRCASGGRRPAHRASHSRAVPTSRRGRGNARRPRRHRRKHFAAQPGPR